MTTTTTIGPGRTKTTFATYVTDVLGSSLSDDHVAQICADLNECPSLAGVTFGAFRVTVEGSNLDGNLRTASDPIRYVAGRSGFNWATNSLSATMSSRVTLKDLQFYRTGAYSSVVSLSPESGVEAIVERCVFDRTAGGLISANGAVSGATVTVRSSAIINRGGAATQALICQTAGVTVGLYNNTFANPYNGTSSASGAVLNYTTATITNNVFVGPWGTNRSGGTVSGSNNATDKATADGLPATSLRTSITNSNEFVTWNLTGTHDLNLKGATSVDLLDNGTTGGGVPAFDIANQSQSGAGRDIGASEYQSAPPPVASTAYPYNPLGNLVIDLGGLRYH